MSVSTAQILRIWDRRIETLKIRIKLLQAQGLNYNDDEMKEIYARLKYFQDCRKKIVAESIFQD